MVTDKFNGVGVKSRGAVLIAVLIISVVLVVLMGVTSKLMDSRLQLALHSKQMYRDKTAVYAKANELSYLLATQRLTVAGVSQGIAKQSLERNDDGLFLNPIAGDEIRTDGYQYNDDTGMKYSIQNENGLIPINSSGQYWLKRWLKAQGYNMAEQAKFADILADYADADDWRRPGGAEKSEYNAKKLSEPANFLLQNCSELQQLLLWQELLKQHPEYMGYCSLRRTPSININAIPIRLWQMIWPQSATQLAQRRKNNSWFIYADEVSQIEPSFINESDEMYSPLGGNTFKLIVNLHQQIYNSRVTIGTNLHPPVVFKANVDFSH